MKRLLPAILVLTLALAVPAQADAALRVGIHSSSFLNQEETQRMALGGTRIIRVPFVWKRMQPFPDGAFDFAAYDELVERSAAAGIEVLPVVVETPDWIRHFQAAWPTSSGGQQLYSAFLRRLVRRYGPGGSFWAAHPELPAIPVRAWQIWNEPNLGPFSPRAKGRASDYAVLLLESERVIHRVDPEAKIVLAGMPQHLHGQGSTFYDFVVDLFAIEGTADAVDVMAIHPYAQSIRQLLQRVLPDMTEAANDAAGRRLETWITELGWATHGEQDRRFVTSRPGQAALIERAIAQLERRASTFRLRRLIVFAWRDLVDPVNGGAWQFHTGLFELDGTDKPAWTAFARAAGGLPGDGTLPPALETAVR
jgi:polysaccharide biosynthesis protein PslG